MSKIYLIRHGETKWNIEKRYQGITDIELSENGIQQARVLAKRFRNIDLYAVYTSPLKRAADTAEIIAFNRNIPVIKDKHFIEIDFGHWEGFTFNELKQKYGQEYLNFIGNPFKHTFPGEGSYDIVTKRAIEGFKNAFEQSNGKDFAIVSHGGLLKALIINLLNLPGSFYSSMQIDNTGISIVEFNGKRSKLIKLNDNSHL